MKRAPAKKAAKKPAKKAVKAAKKATKKVASQKAAKKAPAQGGGQEGRQEGAPAKKAPAKKRAPAKKAAKKRAPARRRPSGARPARPASPTGDAMRREAGAFGSPLPLPDLDAASELGDEVEGLAERSPRRAGRGRASCPATRSGKRRPAARRRPTRRRLPRCPWCVRYWLRWASRARTLISSKPSTFSTWLGSSASHSSSAAGAVRRQLLIGEEEGIAGGHQRVGEHEAGVAVVRVQAVAAPRVVAEDDVGPDQPDPPADLPLLADPVAELAVGEPEERTSPPPKRALRLVAAPPGARPRATPGPRSGSQVPLDPSVSTRWWISHPAAAHLARVPPQPNSMSSGWAPTARARAGRGEVDG